MAQLVGCWALGLGSGCDLSVMGTSVNPERSLLEFLSPSPPPLHMSPLFSKINLKKEKRKLAFHRCSLVFHLGCPISPAQVPSN